MCLVQIDSNVCLFKIICKYANNISNVLKLLFIGGVTLKLPKCHLFEKEIFSPVFSCLAS